jgi:hypothetical protein
MPMLVFPVALALLMQRHSPDASWAELSGYYRYVTPPDYRVFEQETSQIDTLEVSVYFPGYANQFARGIFIRPIAPGRYPLVLLLHGLGGSKENAIRSWSKPFLDAGCAVFALDAPYHGDSRTKDEDAVLAKMYDGLGKLKSRRDLIAEALRADTDHEFEKFLTDVIHNGVLNYRLALDYLSKRPDVDPNRIHVLGASMGAMMGAVLASVDNRVRSLCLLVGGDPLVFRLQNSDSDERLLILPASPSLYIPHLSGRPLLMLNGLHDATMPTSAATVLFQCAAQPKEIRWYRAGHELNDEAHRDAIAWVVNQARQP